MAKKSKEARTVPSTEAKVARMSVRECRRRLKEINSIGDMPLEAEQASELAVEYTEIENRLQGAPSLDDGRRPCESAGEPTDMYYRTLAALRGRAGELAKSGHFHTCDEIVAALRWEGQAEPERAIRGDLTRIWLRSLMRDARNCRKFDA